MRIKVGTARRSVRIRVLQEVYSPLFFLRALSLFAKNASQISRSEIEWKNLFCQAFWGPTVGRLQKPGNE